MVKLFDGINDEIWNQKMPPSLTRKLDVETLESRELLTTTPNVESSAQQFEPNSIVVRFDSEAAAIIDGLTPFPNATLSEPLKLLPGARKVTLPFGVEVDQAIQAFSQLSSVRYAEPNFLLQSNELVIPDDAEFEKSWSLHNTGQDGGTVDADIDAPEAWAITTGEPSTIVAVLDTGIDPLHPDLAPNIWINQGEIPGDSIDNDKNGFVDDVHGWDFVNNDNDPTDDHSHGSHISGTIAAVGNNEIGVAGVAWNVKIIPLKVLDSNNNGSSFVVAQALDYAVQMGATVSNNSYGDMVGQILYDAIVAAGHEQHVYVASAGNGGKDTDTIGHPPSTYDEANIIAVAATDRNDRLAGFSNFGANSVDLGAPGQGIYNTSINGRYETKSGTSMATPHVTGAVALIQSLRPDWGVAKVREVLLSNVDQVPSLSGKTASGGRLNVDRALSAAFPNSPEVLVRLEQRILRPNSSAVEFGSTVRGAPVDLTFSVMNLSREQSQMPLILSSLTVAEGFSILANFQSDELPSGADTTFTLRLDANQIGSFDGSVSFSTNDADDEIFLFQVSGLVSGLTMVMDDNDPGFSIVGVWPDWASGYNNGSVFNSPGAGWHTAAWKFDVEPGVYKVAATWPTERFWAKRAPFVVSDGDSRFPVVIVDQSVEARDFVDRGVGWKALGEFEIFGNQLNVTLNDSAQLEVVADAIRIERIRDLEQISVIGDSNGDGVFNSSDLITVFQAGEYEDDVENNSTFEEGDWNGDGEFDSNDFIFAFANGDYSSASKVFSLPFEPVLDKQKKQKHEKFLLGQFLLPTSLNGQP